MRQLQKVKQVFVFIHFSVATNITDLNHFEGDGQVIENPFQ